MNRGVDGTIVSAVKNFVQRFGRPVAIVCIAGCGDGIAWRKEFGRRRS